jgi:hypothetical protein
MEMSDCDSLMRAYRFSKNTSDQYYFRAFTQSQSLHAGAVSAQSHANSELLRALIHRVCDTPVDSGRRQTERQQAECVRQRRGYGIRLQFPRIRFTIFPSTSVNRKFLPWNLYVSRV